MPERWQIKLKEHLEQTGAKYNELSADAFRHNLKIELSDGSYAFFYYAFYWIENDWKDIAVFTEHCGYHIFPLIGTKLELTDFKGNIVKAENY